MTADPDRGASIRLRPALSMTLASLIGAVIIVAVGAFSAWGGFAIGFSSHNGWVISVLGGTFAVVGLALGAGSLRLELVLRDHDATVRGYVTTVHIPRNAVKKVTDYPAILWTDSRGQSRTTRVNALSLYRSGTAQPRASIEARARSQRDQLQSWATPAS